MAAFWLRAFPGITELLRSFLWAVLDAEEDPPGWLVKGQTVMQIGSKVSTRDTLYSNQKCSKQGNRTNFGPSHVLQAVDHSILAEMLLDHVVRKDMLPGEQKAMRRGRRGCLDALVIDGPTSREAQVHKRSLSTAWFDYRKAYIMVPHE